MTQPSDIANKLQAGPRCPASSVVHGQRSLYLQQCDKRGFPSQETGSTTDATHMISHQVGWGCMGLTCS